MTLATVSKIKLRLFVITAEL